MYLGKIKQFLNNTNLFYELQATNQGKSLTTRSLEPTVCPSKQLRNKCYQFNKITYSTQGLASLKVRQLSRLDRSLLNPKIDIKSVGSHLIWLNSKHLYAYNCHKEQLFLHNFSLSSLKLPN